MANLFKIWFLFDRAHKLRAIFLGFVVLTVSILDTLGTLSIVPLISVVFGNAEYLEAEPIQEIMLFLDLENRSAVIALASLSLTMFLISLLGIPKLDGRLTYLRAICGHNSSNYLAWHLQNFQMVLAIIRSFLSETHYLLKASPAIN